MYSSVHDSKLLTSNITVSICLDLSVWNVTRNGKANSVFPVYFNIKGPEREECKQIPQEVCKKVTRKIPYEEQYELCQRCRREAKEVSSLMPDDRQ